MALNLAATANEITTAVAFTYEQNEFTSSMEFPAREGELLFYPKLSGEQVAFLVVTAQKFLGMRTLNRPLSSGDIDNNVFAFAAIPEVRELIANNSYQDSSKGARSLHEDKQRLLRVEVANQIIPVIMALNAIEVTCEKDKNGLIGDKLLTLMVSGPNRKKKLEGKIELFPNCVGKFFREDLNGKPDSEYEPPGVVLLKGNVPYERICQALRMSIQPFSPFLGVARPGAFNAG